MIIAVTNPQVSGSNSYYTPYGGTPTNGYSLLPHYFPASYPNDNILLAGNIPSDINNLYNDWQHRDNPNNGLKALNHAAQTAQDGLSLTGSPQLRAWGQDINLIIHGATSVASLAANEITQSNALNQQVFNQYFGNNASTDFGGSLGQGYYPYEGGTGNSLPYVSEPSLAYQPGNDVYIYNGPNLTNQFNDPNFSSAPLFADAPSYWNEIQSQSYGWDNNGIDTLSNDGFFNNSNSYYPNLGNDWGSGTDWGSSSWGNSTNNYFQDVNNANSIWTNDGWNNNDLGSGSNSWSGGSSGFNWDPNSSIQDYGNSDFSSSGFGNDFGSSGSSWDSNNYSSTF